MTLDESLALARQHQQAGRLREAEQTYRQVLAQQPGRVEALDALAEILFRSGNPAAASELLCRAIASNPASASLHTNLGIALAAQRRFEEAIESLRRALNLQPDSPHILMNLASALKDAGKFDDAIRTCRQVVALEPSNAAAYYRLATCQRDGGDLPGAIDAYRHAADFQPDSVQTHNDLANCLYLTGRFEEAVAHYQQAIALRPDYLHGQNNASVCLHELGRFDEATAAARRAIELNPNFPEAFYNLGRALLSQRRFVESAAACEQALKLRPGYVEARNNLAIALEAAGSLDRAISEYRMVLAAKPDYLDAKMNYGVALKNSGRVDDAIRVHREILDASPGFDDARWNLGITHLLKGDFTEGWAAYEARRKIKCVTGIRDFPQPLWTGEPLAGRRILLHTEQGLGDAIQFIRYVPLVRQAGGQIIVLCYEPLRRLFSNQLGIEQPVTDRDPLPMFDVHSPLLSLPGIMQTNLETIPADVPYLQSDPTLVEKWRARLSAQPARLKVGLVWAGSPVHSRDHDRSLPLSALAPLARVQGAQFFSLQKGHRSFEAQTPPPGMNLIDCTPELIDFVDTAALIENLDVVIAADTAVAHLAGALGKSVWLLLPFAPDWRWMLDRADSPWYPTMRLFRQKRWGDWTDPVNQIVEALAAF